MVKFDWLYAVSAATVVLSILTICIVVFTL
jgi:hypothetical protein